MQATKLNIHDKLPLTCSRSGNCCHGNLVMLNPYELACLAREKNVTPAAFRNLYTDFGGIRLRFDGKPGWKNKKACSQYIDSYGCSVHVARPLACRLFPLGRQIQSNEVNYMYQGTSFPCLDGCAEVLELEQLTVGEYMKGQQTEPFETAQNEYLLIMQNLADIAFELLLDSGLSPSTQTDTLVQWRKMGSENPESLAERIAHEWMDILMIPEIEIDNPSFFAQQHNTLLQIKVQEQFGTLQTIPEIQEACCLIMGVAFHLARGLGANPEILAEHWIEIAKRNRAME